jgi:hypothetical protein
MRSPTRSRSAPLARPTPKSRVLALQRTVGNRAVGRMLQRQPNTPTELDVKSDEAVTSTLVLDEKIGVLPLLSFSQGQEGEIQATVPSTAHDVDLLRYSGHGVKIAHVKISTRMYDIELDDVYVASCNTSRAGSDGIVSITLNYGSIRLKTPERL